MKLFNTLLLLVLFQHQGWSNEGELKLKIKKTNDNEISFSISNQKNLTITIYDSNHNSVLSEQINDVNHSTLTYNLTNYQDGNYYLIVTNDVKSVKHTIVITKRTATLSPTPIMETFLNDLENLQIVSTH